MRLTQRRRQRLLASTCGLAAIAALGSAASAQEAVERATYQPFGEIVARAGSDETGVSLEGWLPVVQGSDALLFIDGRIGVTDHTDAFSNLGIGARAIVGDSVVVGGYGYFDYSRDEAKRDFYGATFGAEVMTPRFELRANYYLPTTDDKYLGTTVDPTGALLIEGNELLERRNTMSFDLAAMKGVDAEVGVKLFATDDGTQDFRIYGGGYHYWDRHIEDIDGGYGEVEYRLNGLLGEGSSLALSGRVSDDNWRGTEVSGQLRLRIAFGKPRGGAAKLTGIESRMTERVRRRGPIMVQTRLTPGTRDFGVLNNLTGEEFGQFFFVDGTSTAGAGDPGKTTTLADALARAGAGDTIVAEGGNGNIATTGITLADGVSLVGGGATVLQVRTENGGVRPFTLGATAGTIANSDGATNTLTLGNGNIVAGVNLIGGANGIVGNGISGATIQDVTISGVGQRGIALTDAGLVSIGGGTVHGGEDGAIAIGGTSLVALDGLTLASTGGTVLSFDGTGADLFIAKFADLAVLGGNGETGGVSVTDAIFDANPLTAAVETVDGGDLSIGATGRVGGGGLILDGVLGSVAFGDVDIFTDGGDGLYIRDGEGKAGSFFFGNTSGTIDAIGGAAVDIDPVTVASTFDSITSTGSPGAGLVFDTVAGSFKVIGLTKVTDPATHGIVIRNSTADFDFGATEITGFSGTGLDLTGAKGNATFASLKIVGNGAPGSKGIDLSGSTKIGGFLGTTDPSSIAGVGIGVDLTGALITGTFQFGDGSDTDGNGAASSITAITPIVATGLGLTGTYNFLDAELTGDITGLTGHQVTVFFVDSTPGAGTADDPGSLEQAEASGADIIILVNDGLGDLDAAGSGADDTFVLLAGQRLTGFSGQSVVTYYQNGPQENLLVHGLAPAMEVTVDDPTGNGAATLVSSLGDALTLSGNNIVDHVTIGASTGFGVIVDGISGPLEISDSIISSLGIDGGSGAVTLLHTDLTGSAGAVLSVTGGHSGTLTIDAASSITTSTGTGIAFDNAAGSYTIAAPVSLTGAGIDVTGTNGFINFTDVDIALTEDNSVGLDLNGATFTGAFTANDFDITSTSATGTVGVDLRNATGVVRLGDTAAGGGSASISGVETGFLIDNTSNVTFTFGDGENPVDVASVIDAQGIAIDIGDNDGSVGSFNFRDVDWTQASNALSYANLESAFTVYYIDAEGDGDGSADDPGSFEGALLVDPDVIILVNQNASGVDTIDLASITQGAVNTFTMRDGQGLFSFNGGEQINLAMYGYSMGGAPTNFSFTAITNIGTLIDNPGAGTGAPVLTSTADTDVISLADGGHFVIAGVVVEAPSNTAVGGSHVAGLLVDDSSLSGGRGLYLNLHDNPSAVNANYVIRNSELAGTVEDAFVLHAGDGDEFSLSVSGSRFFEPYGSLIVIAASGSSGRVALSDIVTSSPGFQSIYLKSESGGELTITQVEDIATGGAGAGGLHATAGFGGKVTFDADADTAEVETVIANNLTFGSSEAPVFTGLQLYGVGGALTVENFRAYTEQQALGAVQGTGSASFTLSILGGDIEGGNAAGTYEHIVLADISADVSLDTISVSNASTAISLAGVTGVGVDGNAFSVGSLTVDESTHSAIRLNNVNGGVTITDGTIGEIDNTDAATVYITGGSGDYVIGTDIARSIDGWVADIDGHIDGSVTFTGAINGTGGSGIRLADNTSAIEFGTVTLGNYGLKVIGTTGAVSFDSLSVALDGGYLIGADLSEATIDGPFIATDFTVTSTDANGSVGINLMGTTGTGTVQFGDTSEPFGAGLSASISGVGTGVLYDDDTAINFIFGDGEEDVDKGSVIAATTAIDYTDAGGANGLLNFYDVTFPTAGSTANLDFMVDVYWIDADGDGDGTKANPGSFDDPGALAADVLVLVNTNGTTQDVINLSHANQGSIGYYTLQDGQVLASFYGRDTIDLETYGVGSGPPANLLLSNISNATLTNPFAGMAPILGTTGDPLGVVVLADGSTTWIDGIRIGNTGAALTAITGTAFESFTLTNSEIHSGDYGVDLGLVLDATGTTSFVTIRDTSIESDLTALYVNPGNGDSLTVAISDVQVKTQIGYAISVITSGSGAASVGIDGFASESHSGIYMGKDSGATGDFFITDFANISVVSGGGESINVSGLPGSPIIFDADPTTVEIDAVAGGNLTVGDDLTLSGPVDLEDIIGQLDFDSIAIQSRTGLWVSNGSSPGFDFKLTSLGGSITANEGVGLYAHSVSLDMVLDSLDASGGTKGVHLKGVDGSLGILDGAILGMSQTGVIIENSTLDFEYGGTISTSTGASPVRISGQSAGTVTFSGDITVGSGGLGISVENNSGGVVNFTGPSIRINSGPSTGVFLSNNLGATINFAPAAGGSGLEIITTTATGFLATGGGTVTVTGSGNSIMTTTGTAVDVQNVTIGAGGLNWESINTGAAVVGVNLSNTGTGANGAGSGAFTVTGNGTDDSGGTMNGVGVGYKVSGIGALNLTEVDIVNALDNGIHGTNVNGLTLNSVEIDGIADAGADAENSNFDRAAYFENLHGIATITDSTFSNTAGHLLNIRNNSGKLDLTVTGSTFSGSQLAGAGGDDGMLLEANGTSTIIASVTDSGFSDNEGDHFQFATDGGASVTHLTFNNNTLTNSPGENAELLGGGITISPSGSSNLTFEVKNNTVTGNNQGGAIDITTVASTSSMLVQGTIANNTIGNPAVAGSGSLQANGISVENNGNGTLTVLVTGNTVSSWNGNYGIEIFSRTGTGSGGTINATVTNNTLLNPNVATALNGIRVTGGTSSPDAEVGTINVNIGNNTAATDLTTDIRIATRELIKVKLAGYAGAANDFPAIVAYLQAQNPGGATATAAVLAEPATIEGVAAGAVPLPAAPDTPLTP